MKLIPTKLIPTIALAFSLVLLGPQAFPTAHAQLESQPISTSNVASPYAIQLGESTTVKYQIGAKITTGSSAFNRVQIILPVPGEWPEQTVSVAEDSIYEKAREIEYRVLDGGVRQMMVSIPSVPANTNAEVLVTYEVNISPIRAPELTEELIRPRKRSKDIAMALGEGPLLEVRDRSIRNQVKEIVTDPSLPAWEEARELHQWVIDNITETVTKAQSTVDTLEKKSGCNEDRAALFVALARASKIPARLVMVEGSQHAEFCLEDPEGEKRWYPCTFRGAGEFGSVGRAAVVFQKGDNLRMPEMKKRMRLVTEYVNGRGTSAPRVEIVRRVVQ